VGIRSTAAPFLGVWLSRQIGTRSVFVVSAALVALGCLTMLRLSRRPR